MKAVVAGKFYPPHLGHNHLIDSALAACDHVDVLVVDNPAYHIAATQRKAWLEQQHPRATVHIIPDIGKDDDSIAWAAHTMQFLGYKPDVVYSSEPYGITWAHYMGAKHVMVDIDRATIPISGTKVRRDKYASWRYLSPATKAGLATRIVVLGAESTGTTTLARDLATALKAPWVPEIGRPYTESLMPFASWSNDDFYAIGRLQQSYEREIAARSNGVIVCDTNTVATELWQRRYMGATTKQMKAIASADKADLYIITADEIPFVQDGLRDGEHIRHEMHQWFLARIKKTGVPSIVVSGQPADRLAAGLKAARKTIESTRKIT